MPLNQDILTWSRSQPAWQQDALRRIFEHGALTPVDIAALYDVAKEVPGTPKPIPLVASHLSSGGSVDPVRVLSLRNLSNVNAFPAGREVEFARDGITVLFGENGTGKSGYARVLKRACRARLAKAVMGDAFSAPSRVPPSAQLSIEVGGATRTVEWRDGAPLDDDLASVVVYDAACAEAYVETEGEPNFQPFGLRALNELVRACKAMDERIGAELLACRTDKSVFTSLGGEHAVGRLIAALNQATDPVAVRALGTLSDSEHARLKDLGKILLQSDPEPQAKSFEQLALRVTTLASRLETADRFVSAGAIEKFSGYLTQLANANRALQATKALLDARPQLPGTGGPLWSTLILAAKEFSTSEAYPGHPFPHTSDDAKCVLCQGELTELSRVNLADYERFSSSKAAQDCALAAQTLANARLAIQGASADLGLDEATRKDLVDQGADLLTKVEAWAKAWEARRAAMLEAVDSEGLKEIPAIPADAANASDVRRFADELRARARELRASQDPLVRAQLEKEHRELAARMSLAPHVPAIEKYIQNAKLEYMLSQVKARFSSGAASRRMTELADQYISEGLLQGMQEELKAIGYTRSTRHKIPKRTARGVTLFKIALEGSTHQVQEVLSEGEQRATAFAFFLAELRLTDKRSTLVFDDPVTSLDHRYRQKIAERLAALALERQVIVFTHDAVFLTNLQRAADRAKCNIAARRIEWEGGPGHAKPGLGWDNMSSPQRIQKHREELARINASWNEHPNETNKRDIADAYDHLRGSLERILRDSLMNSVIVPFSDEIKVEQFGAVIGVPPSDWEAFLEIYDRACEAMYGHDTTAEAQVATRTPEQLGADLDALTRIVNDAKERAKKCQEVQSKRGSARRKGVELLR